MITPVVTRLDAYRVAIAELPRRAVAGRDAADAVVVVGGDGDWWKQAARAVAGGAAAVVVAQPRAAAPDALDALAERARATPVVAERPLLRPDVTAVVVDALAAVPAPPVLTVECHAPRDALPAALRDAIGWARVLNGAPLTVGSAQSRDGRALGLLEAKTGGLVTVLAATQPGAPPLGRIRISTVAETVVEVDDDGGDLVVSMTDAAGRRTFPTRYERPERVALRRALEAVHASEGPADLAEMRHDAVLAQALLGGAHS
jgi:hypothetical protein